MLRLLVRSAMASDTKFFVKVFPAQNPKKIPKAVTEALKGVAGAKAIARMKKESVDCPVVKHEVGFLVCFACPSFIRRVSGEVHCAGGDGPPKEWLIG
jgi:hypothetical protein